MCIEYRILYVLSLLAVLHAGVARAESAATQNDLRKKIEMAAAAEIESSKTPSLQISIGKGEHVIFEGAYGLADIENEVNASTVSKYRTASVAKWFTATAAMQLSENGSLDLDAPIQTYCPEFSEKEFPITARQLLTHTAGIRGTSITKRRCLKPKIRPKSKDSRCESFRKKQVFILAILMCSNL